MFYPYYLYNFIINTRRFSQYTDQKQDFDFLRTTAATAILSQYGWARPIAWRPLTSVKNIAARMGKLKFCLHWAFKHATLLCVPLCVSCLSLGCLETKILESVSKTITLHKSDQILHGL